MLNKEWKWHYFMMHGMEYLVLGYNAVSNNVLCYCLNHLNETDKEDLMQIVDSDQAQSHGYLVSVLVDHPYAGGGTWWERLQPHIFFAGVEQIRNKVPPEQMKIFTDANYKHLNEQLDKRQREYAAKMKSGDTHTGNLVSETETIGNIDDVLFGPVSRLTE